MMNIKILIATHKKYQMPADEIYLPIHVGKEGKEIELGYTPDNTGDNISSKNANYCELTALYWAWKNLDADYIGLAHYRRHFSFKNKGDKWTSILNAKETQKLCEQNDVIVPNKRKYYIETNYSHYIHAHKKEGLDLMIETVKQDYPDYAAACDLVMHKKTWAHMFNMFVMKREFADKYCEWLFDVLFKVEDKLDIADYSASEARVFGYLSELMLDIWLITNKIKYFECPVMFVEKQNWFRKGGAFLRRKVLSERGKK